MSLGREKIAKVRQFTETDVDLHAMRVEVFAGRRGLPLRPPEWGLPAPAGALLCLPCSPGHRLPATGSLPARPLLPSPCQLRGCTATLCSSGLQVAPKISSKNRQWANVEEILFPQ